MQEKKAYSQYTADTELLASSASAPESAGEWREEKTVTPDLSGAGKPDSVKAVEGASGKEPSGVSSFDPVAETAFPSAGTVLDGRYRLLKKLGSGGTSSVFLAEHLSLGNLWAVKVLPVEGTSLKNHLKEAEILKRLSHPMLPRVIDILEHGSSLCIVMDFVLGHTLAERLREEGPIPEAEVVSWLLQLCDVLHYLHVQTPEPVIYRDLKPSNLIADNFGHLKLVDFGTARRYRQDEGGDTAYIGTQGYAAPEQYGLNQSDPRTDIYNLGMTLFHLLTATHPITVPHGDIERHLAESGVSARFSAIIRKCVQLSPSNRYRNADSLRQEVLLLAPVAISPPDVAQDRYAVAHSHTDKPKVRPSSGFTEGKGFLGKRDRLRKNASGTGSDHAPAPLSGQARIALVAACPGAGATFAAIAIASYLAAKRRTVAIAEMNSSGDLLRFRQQLERLGHVVLPVNGTQYNESAFQFGQIVFHPACRRLTDLRGERPDAMILDLGAARTENAREELLRADWRFVYCPQADWKFGHVMSFMEAMDNMAEDSEFIYLLPHGEKNDSNGFHEVFGSRKTVGFPHIVNPFMPSPLESRHLERMFRLVGLDT